MALLARKTRGELWAQRADAELWSPPNFPYELLPDLIDREGGGLSFYEVKSLVDPSLKRVAAALLAGSKARPGKEIQNLEFRFARRQDVEALGIAIQATPGETRDAAVNEMHREL